MKIVKIAQDDFNEWLDLAVKLWPDYSATEMQDILTEILDSDRETAFIMRDDDGNIAKQMPPIHLYPIRLF